jgi:hypothetical protein
MKKISKYEITVYHQARHRGSIQVNRYGGEISGEVYGTLLYNFGNAS